MSDTDLHPAEASLAPSATERLSATVALLGGLLSLGVASLVVVSVVGRWLFDAPVNGDFELVQMGTAISIFSFLAYCQSRRGNIFVDTFTTRLPGRVTARIDALWDLVYAAMAALIAVSLTTGTIEHFRSGQTTMLLQIIVWPALAICAALAALLAVSALATALARIRGHA